jgi:hypothetical protein
MRQQSVACDTPAERGQVHRFTETVDRTHCHVVLGNFATASGTLGHRLRHRAELLTHLVTARPSHQETTVIDEGHRV